VPWENKFETTKPVKNCLPLSTWYHHLGQLTEWIASLMSVNKVCDHD